MAFDLSTAKPAFDPSTAQPAQPEQPPAQPQQQAQPAEDPGFLENTATSLLDAFKAAGSVVTGVSEPLATVATAIPAQVASGYAGLAGLAFDDPEQGGKNIKAVQDALTYIPKTESGMAVLKQIASVLEPVGEGMKAAEDFSGEVGYQIGGPVTGAITSTLPELALEVLGLGIARRATKAGKVADKAADSAKAADKATDAAKAKKAFDVPADADDLQRLAGDIQSGKTQKVAQAVDADPDIVRAADDLGVDLTPGATSRNRAFVEMEQASKSIPGSRIPAKEQAAIKKLGEQADELINATGGSTDKGILNYNVQARMNSTIGRLSKKSGDLYGRVDSAIPKTHRVDVTNSREYFKKRLEELGGDKSLLSAPEKKLLNMSKAETTPTYAALDELRKAVGDAYNKQGVYKDAAQRSLDNVYAVLSKDQQIAADAFGVGADYKSARKLTSLRKGVEGKTMELFGKHVNDSIIPKLTTSATALTKGDATKFTKLMQALPKNQRAAAASTMLNDLFTLGARNKDSIGQGFVNAYKALNRNKTAKKALFDQLPPGSEKRFDDIGRVSEGLYKAIGLENKSRSARDILFALDDGGLIKRVYSTAKSAAKAEGVSSAMGVPGIGSSAVIGGAIVKGKTPATQAADAFLVSPGLKKAVTLAAEGRAADAAKVLKKSPQYKKWLTTVSKRDAAQIATVGLIPWLTGQHEDK